MGLWNFRAGLYDHECLKLLESRLDELYRQGVPPDLAPSVERAAELVDLEEKFVHPHGWQPFLDRRNEIARLIERLSE